MLLLGAELWERSYVLEYLKRVCGTGRALTREDGGGVRPVT